REGRAQAHAVVRVTDTGVGIDPDMLSRVFDLFTQGDQSLGQSRGGLGIGLSIVRSLVELHGGTVTAHSDGRGHGSEFTVTLPFFQRAQQPEAEREASGPDIAVSGGAPD